MDEVNYTYYGKFEGDILAVGRTESGKTTSVQNLGKNSLFGDIREVYWISKIELFSDRENNMRDCCKDQYVDFKCTVNAEDFKDLLEIY